MDKVAVLVKGAQKAIAQRDELLQKNAELEQRLDLFDKRALAEQILLEARSTPSNLRTSSLDEFMSKRAELEDKTVEELLKLADLVGMLDMNDDGEVDLVDLDGFHDPNADPATFDEWVINY